MFINGSHLCYKITNDNLLCLEHECKKILSDTCNICLGEMKEFVFVECGHTFHKECIGEWLLKKTTCPCCRSSLKPKFDIERELNNVHYQINQYTTVLTTRDFIEWFLEMSRTYIDGVTSISLLDMLYVVQNNSDHLQYFITIFNNDRNNISINLFELELKLNNIANSIRESNENENENVQRYYYNQIDSENDSESENESQNESENDIINDEFIDYEININELEFTEF